MLNVVTAMENKTVPQIPGEGQKEKETTTACPFLNKDREYIKNQKIYLLDVHVNRILS
jgi:hypothetical protein